ncbi:tyrosine-type recombinase/integrase [Peribacillus simplex]|uniref:tyrosine-type recombinase/integrase n=1 Tax=Peribacillus simplex TaxID=1478 RepID=UPI003D28B183
MEQQKHYSEPIFYNQKNKPLNPRGLHKIFKETTLERAGLPAHRFSLHHLRYTFATLLLGVLPTFRKFCTLRNFNPKKADFLTYKESTYPLAFLKDTTYCC